jgi:hypothetical protein
MNHMDAQSHFDQTPGSGRTYYPKIHTLFSTECSPYFDWQTVGFVRSFYLSGQPGQVSRFLSCTDEKLKTYTGHDSTPAHYVPSMSHHPLTGTLQSISLQLYTTGLIMHQ